MQKQLPGTVAVVERRSISAGKVVANFTRRYAFAGRNVASSAVRDAAKIRLAYILRGKCGLFDRDKCGRILPGLRRDGGPFLPGEKRPV